MSYVRSLGYIGLGVSDLDAWRSFATDILGLMVDDREDGAVDLRCDAYSWRIRLHADEADDLLYAGWEVADGTALKSLADTLKQSGTQVSYGTPDDYSARNVEGLIRFEDPEGTKCEAFFGPLQRTDRPFVSPLGVTFHTGAQGLGHIVLTAKNPAMLEAFYTELLGFRISDFIKTEVVPGRPIDITFMRCNDRHHSLALAPVPIPKRLVHIMLETTDVDQVGRAMYRATDAGMHLSFT
ncbi:MAG: VOC family protein, partial [Pseudomonadota bacterium]